MTKSPVSHPKVSQKRFSNQARFSGPTNHTRLISKDGAERIISHSWAPIRDKTSVVVGVVLVFRDITDQQHMLREALKAEKLESVGILAGGIAHDFNNILTAVVGNLSLAKMGVNPESKVFRIAIRS